MPVFVLTASRLAKIPDITIPGLTGGFVHNRIEIAIGARAKKLLLVAN